MSLKNIIRLKIPFKRKNIQHICNTYGNEVLDKITVNQMFNGSNNMKNIYWETSIVERNNEIKFRGYSLKELERALPISKYNTNITPEAMLWLLLSDSLPNEKNILNLQNELLFRSYLPEEIDDFIKKSCKNTNPLTILSQCLLLCKPQSRYGLAVNNFKTSESDLWEYLYEDSLEIISLLPIIVASIYRKKYHDDYEPITYSSSNDYTTNFMQMMKLEKNEELVNFMRLYLGMHVDFGGGNSSSQTSKIVSSTMADPYSTLCASYQSLSGPLHGNKTYKIMFWINLIHEYFTNNNIKVNKSHVKDFIIKMQENNLFIPGFMCANDVDYDSRFIIQKNIIENLIHDDERLQIVYYLEDVMKDVYNTNINSNIHKSVFAKSEVNSGSIFYKHGITETEFYVVLLAMSRSIGILSQMVWDKALLFPLYNAKSINMDYMDEHFKKTLINKLGYHLY